jgi:hypothetical protein
MLEFLKYSFWADFIWYYVQREHRSLEKLFNAN